ncbi:hypothetical protein BDV97DRAFT_373252 [Delphinella strobiligena]|nr:hypothetical protein BDV97DRAFT_373252 [Delphinella strobiligena]
MDGAFNASASMPADDALHKYLLSTIVSRVPLDIRTSTIKGAGSGIVTLRPVPAGVEIFRVKEPFVSAAHDATSVCDNCYISSAASAGGAARYSEEKLNLLDCKRCRSVRYCSKACQVSAWGRHHKAECLDLKVADLMTSDKAKSRSRALAINMAFARVMRKYVRNEITSEERSAIENLVSHRDNFIRPIYDDFVKTSMLHLGTDAKSGLSVDEGFEIYCKILTNSMSIRHANVQESLGITLDPFASMLNHSCDPNVYFFVEGNQLRFRTIRPISDGEELFISYTDPSYDVKSRGKELLMNYYFECTCRRCNIEVTELKIAQLDAKSMAARMEIQENLLKSQHVITFSGLSPDAIEDYMRAILAAPPPATRKRLALDEGWPEHHQPMPDMRIFIATLTQSTDTEYSLKSLLKLCFVNFPLMYGGPNGTDWVKAFSLLVFTLRLFIKKNAEPTIAPGATDWSLVFVVYLKAMIKDAEKCYGSDTAFVQVNQRLFLKDIEVYSLDVLCSAAFVSQFRSDQIGMLTWAGIPGTKGVELPDTGLSIT